MLVPLLFVATITTAATLAPLSSSEVAAAWPVGAQGDLVVKKDETVSLQPGGVYDFKSITVESGGTIELLPGDKWTIIGCASDMVLKGRIVGRSGAATGSAQTTAIAPDSEQLVHFASRSEGGAGGNSWGCGMPDFPNPNYHANGGSPSGPPSPGNGGGGASTTRAGASGSPTGGGDGATAQNSPGDDIGAGGAGAKGWSAPGAPGASANGPSNGQNFGGGGGGGARGRHGQPIYLHVAGSFMGVGGIVDVSGSDGGSGGAGGSAHWTNSHFFVTNLPGAGGGGGAGGSGGTVILKYGANYLPPQFVLHGGKGGAGGAPGIADNNPNRRACPGQSGFDGNDGRLVTKSRSGSLSAR